MKIIIATIKSWNIKNAYKLKEVYRNEHEIEIITEKEELVYDKIKMLNPNFIFFPHWSYYIPKEIYTNYCCIVFHMTDLPYGRGGSPLQNLIVRGIYNTKISAIRVDEGIDSGNIFMKKEFSLKDGSADEILVKMSKIIFFEMIPEFLRNHISEQPQIGEATLFKRRKPEESKITEKISADRIYDFIRMLDGEGYPKAFFEIGELRFEFSKAKVINGNLKAEVHIIKKGDKNEDNTSCGGTSR